MILSQDLQSLQTKFLENLTKDIQIPGFENENLTTEFVASIVAILGDDLLLSIAEKSGKATSYTSLLFWLVTLFIRENNVNRDEELKKINLLDPLVRLSLLPSIEDTFLAHMKYIKFEMVVEYYELIKK